MLNSLMILRTLIMRIAYVFILILMVSVLAACGNDKQGHPEKAHSVKKVPGRSDKYERSVMWDPEKPG